MKKMKPTIAQMREIAICYMTKICTGIYAAGIEFTIYQINHSRNGTKGVFADICFNYSLISQEDKNIVNQILKNNNITPLESVDLDFFKPSEEELQLNEKYVYLNNFCKYIKDLNYYGYTEQYPVRKKEQPWFAEESLSRALFHIKNYHEDVLIYKIEDYLEKTAKAIANLPPEEFNEVDKLAKKYGVLTVKEAFDKFIEFRRKFKENKCLVESEEYLDWRGTGTYFPTKRKKTVSLKEDINKLRMSFSNSEHDMHPISENQKNVIEIEYTGSYSKDAEQAYNLSNIPRNDLYVWHYVGNYKPNTNTGEVELVLKEAHDAIEHATGVEDYEKLKGVTYTP